MGSAFCLTGSAMDGMNVEMAVMSKIAPPPLFVLVAYSPVAIQVKPAMIMPKIVVMVFMIALVGKMSRLVLSVVTTVFHVVRVEDATALCNDVTEYAIA